MNRGRANLISDSGLVLRAFHVRPPVPEPPTAVTVPPVATPEPGRRRLSGPDPHLDERLLPFRRHWPDQSWNEDWCLYWVPASFENRADTRADPRFHQVFERLIALTNEKSQVRGFTFMDSQFIYPHLIEHLILNAIEYLPLGAMGFCPGRGPVNMPKYDEIVGIDFRAAYEKLKEKKEAFRANDIFPRMPKPQQYIMGDQDLARRNLMGRGGYTFFLARHAQPQFSEIGKQILSENTADPLMHEIPMPVPLFDSAAFTTARAEQLATYFNMFDLYVAESPADNGILIAASRNLDEALPQLIEDAGYRERKRRRSLWRNE
jgi:hypothetical protein